MIKINDKKVEKREKIFFINEGMEEGLLLFD